MSADNPTLLVFLHFELPNPQMDTISTTSIMKGPLTSSLTGMFIPKKPDSISYEMYIYNDKSNGH